MTYFVVIDQGVFHNADAVAAEYAGLKSGWRFSAASSLFDVLTSLLLIAFFAAMCYVAYVRGKGPSPASANLARGDVELGDLGGSKSGAGNVPSKSTRRTKQGNYATVSAQGDDCVDDVDNEDGSMLSVRSPQASSGEGINSASEQAELDFAIALSMSEGADNKASEQVENDGISKASKSESSNSTSDTPISSKSES